MHRAQRTRARLAHIRGGMIVDVFCLLFTQHMNQLDATQDHAGMISGLKAEHQSYAAFVGAVILLDAVVEVLILPDPDRLEPAS